MGGQLLYELHVSWYAFLAIILQEYVSEIFSVNGRSRCPALPCTLLACGWRDSLKLASDLHAKLLIKRPGRCGTSPDIFLPGHFSIPNDVVGETQKGGVKNVWKPKHEGNKGYSHLLQTPTSRHTSITFFFFLRIICPYSVVSITSWTRRPRMKMRITKPVPRFSVLSF